MTEKFSLLHTSNMSKASSLRRHSFHSDRDLKGTQNMLELEKALLWKKANVDKSRAPGTNGGFEAPRNSLDVPASGFTELRKCSAVRYDDIPIGYELSRSLTGRRRNEEFSARKSMSSVEAMLSKPKFFDKGKMHTDQMSGAPSVVARLMGLDPLPHQRDASQCPSELVSKKAQPHDFFTSEREPSIFTKQRSMSHVSAQRGNAYFEENLSDLKPAMRNSNVLPFRDHPQERQLQAFKKELERKLPMSSKVDMHLEKGLQREREGFKIETLQESQEFLDALEFLHSNKEFFAKVLKDPNSLFARHIQERGVGARKQGWEQIKESKLTRSLSESKTRDAKQVSDSETSSFSSIKGPYLSLPLAHEVTKSDNVQATNLVESIDKGPLIVCMSHFGQDEHMPQGRYLPSSSLKPVNDQRLPTKIVVLRPKLGKHARTMPSVPFSPPSDVFGANGMFMPRLETKESTTKNDIKERLRCKPLAAAKNHSKDHLKDAGDIASHTVEEMKEDMAKRLLREKEVASLAKSSSRGNHVPTQRSANGDTTCASDGEGYCSLSRRMTKGNVMANVSLPSSPRLSRSEPEVHSKYFGSKDRRGVYGEKKLSKVPSSSNTQRDARRDNVNVGHVQAILDTKQDSVRDFKPQSNTRKGRHKGSSNDARGPMKLLQRSPSAQSVVTRNLESEQNSSMNVNRLPMACSNTTRIAESSLFKERLLSLKDSISLSKKKSGKKSSMLHSELPSRSHSANVSDFRDSHSTTSSVYPWRAATSLQAQKDKAAIEGCQHDDGVSVNRTKALDLVNRWSVSGDLLESASGSDVSLEKSEQPSPVSVLIAPFDEESPSSEQSDSVCHEASLMRFSPIELDCTKRLLDLHSMQLSSVMTPQQSSSNSVAEYTLCDSKVVKNPLETISMFGIACACGTEDELVYIRDLLAFAGFTNNEHIQSHAFSREHSLNPSLFKKMESYYASIKGTIGHIPLNLLTRKMLFDVVDEILSWKLGEPTLQLGPIRQEKLNFHVAHTGKEVLEQIWAHICNHRYVSCEYSEVDSLDALASRDFMKDNSWMHSQSDVEAVALELEKLVCGDLIREMTHEFKLKLIST